MMKLKHKKKKWMLTGLLLAFCVPIITFASSAGSGVSGLEVAKYKMEGAQTKAWTDLPISTSSNTNSYDISITKPGTTVVTLYAQDKAGNQNYQIKSFTITQGMKDAPVDKIEYKLTGATTKDWTSYTGPFTITEEGETYLEAKVYDEAGNITSVKQTIRLDKTNPVNAKAVITLQ